MSRNSLASAAADDKDFRPDRWDATEISANGDGEYVGHVEKPAPGHVAFFAEVTYPFGAVEYALWLRGRPAALRDDWTASRGGRAAWKQFQDEFLQFGGPPIPLIRRAMMGSDDNGSPF